MRKFNCVVAVVVTLMAGALVACKGSADDKSENKTTEVVREPSTRTQNSVIGKWYVYEEYDPDEVYIWEFGEDGKYLFATEEGYNKQSDSYTISKYPYSVIGDKLIMDLTETKKLEYTDYGFCLTDESGHQKKFCEYKQDALETSDAYYASDLYLETMTDKNGCVIQDEVLLAYFINDKNIVIPNVKTISGGVIKTDLEHLKSIRIPGCVEKIGNGAFGELSVDKIYIEDGVKEIGNYAFSDSYFDELYIPTSVESIGELAFFCEEANIDGKIYVKKGSYAEEFLKDAYFDGEVIVE